MASPGGTSSGSSLQQNSSSEEEMQLLIMDERKRKRKESNRESAKRSRMRKQKHLDELTTQVSHLTKTKHQLINNLSVTTQHYLKVESENSVLRAQMSELINRLQSLNEISNVLSACNNNHGDGGDHYGVAADGLFPMIVQEDFASDSFFMNPCNTTTCFNQPIMASATMFQS